MFMSQHLSTSYVGLKSSSLSMIHTSLMARPMPCFRHHFAQLSPANFIFEEKLHLLCSRRQTLLVRLQRPCVSIYTHRTMFFMPAYVSLSRSLAALCLSGSDMSASTMRLVTSFHASPDTGLHKRYAKWAGMRMET